MELRPRSSPRKAVTARALATAEVEAAKAVASTPPQRPDEGAKPPKKALSELVKRLEDKESMQRTKKRALVEENRKLKVEMAKLDKMLKGQVQMTADLEMKNAALQEIQVRLTLELEETKGALKDEREKVQRLNKDLEEHQRTLKDGFEKYERLSHDLKEQKCLNSDLAAAAKQSAFKSRLHRTALAAGFKLLPALVDQVTFRSLVIRTEKFLRLKIAKQEAAGSIIPSIEKGDDKALAFSSAATRGGDYPASIHAKQFRFACEDDDDSDEDVKPPLSFFDLEEDRKMLLAGDSDDLNDDVQFAVKFESPAGACKPRRSDDRNTAAASPKRKLGDTNVCDSDSDSDVPLRKLRKLCRGEDTRIDVCDLESDSDVPLRKLRKLQRGADMRIAGEDGQDPSRRGQLGENRLDDE